MQNLLNTIEKIAITLQTKLQKQKKKQKCYLKYVVDRVVFIVNFLHCSQRQNYKNAQKFGIT